MSITKIGFPLAAMLAAALFTVTADAQQPATQPGTPPAKIALSTLTAQGFEIKSAVPSGGQFQVVYLQKGKDAFACIVAQLAANQSWKSDCYHME